MQNERNLLDIFRIPGISETDLLTYLQQGDSYAENNIYYFLADQLKLEFNKRGNIKNITGSPESGLIKRAVQDLKEISQEQEIEQSRVVVQGVSPLTGFFKYKEIFQITPLKSRPTHIANGRSKFPYPFLLEYKYRTSKNNGIRINRMQKTKEEILLILNLLIYGGISDVNTSSSHSIWVTTPTDWRNPTQKEKDMFCEYKHPVSMERINMNLSSGFGLDKIDVNHSEFAQTSEFKQVELVDFKTYYHRLGVGIDDEINLPSIIDRY